MAIFAVIQGELCELLSFLISGKRNEKCACISLYSVKTNVESDMQNQVFLRKIK